MLNTVLTFPTSSETTSVITMLKFKILNRLHMLTPDGTTEDNILQLYHPILPTETLIDVPVDRIREHLDQGQVQQFRKVMLHRAQEARIVSTSEFLEWCISGSVPYEAAKTLSISSYVMCQTAIHAVHQMRFAESLRGLLSASLSDLGPALVDIVIKHTLYVYDPDPIGRPAGLQLVAWLDDPGARHTIEGALNEYKTRLATTYPPRKDLLSLVEEVMNTLISLHTKEQESGMHIGFADRNEPNTSPK
ncbi:hypothetical protein C8J57DRAFT_1376614 [Mycena rebaudengoi]|nr:hypothetical protein C8J57DRAFT_1376614 [Mycena rebaudengoi]